MVSSGVLIAVGGGWHAVSRRGLARTISVVVAIAGRRARIVAAWWSGDFSIASAASRSWCSAAISVGTARVALGRTDKDLAATVSSALPSAPPGGHPC